MEVYGQRERGGGTAMGQAGDVQLAILIVLVGLVGFTLVLLSMNF
jgi:hypothetical protein